MPVRRLVECVPNFSEGRDESVIAALIAAVESVPGVVLLDRTSDPDHHRSVLTFVGPPDFVAEAAFQAVRVASQRIDLRRHGGGHPRVGAADVVPFVPISGVTMADCVALAKHVGARIGQELQIPVFFYEEAAVIPERRRLESIRRGGLEGLAVRMASDNAWKPDCGPARPHPTAGVTVVGARPVLVAFNVNLASRDLSIAKAIAKSVRASSGGLAHVKAIGVDLPSRRQVQVSMNLTDIDVTPLHVAYEAVREQAARAGVSIAESELIGLAPQRAVTGAARARLRLRSLEPAQVLETKLASAAAAAANDGLLAWPLADILTAVGAKEPTPAGASVAAWVAALAAQLGAKVRRIRPAAGQTESGPGGPASFSRLSDRLARLAEVDTRAYGAVLDAQRLNPTDPKREQALAEAMGTATQVPLEMAEAILELMQLLAQHLPELPTPLAADVQVARLLARGAVASMLVIVDNNMNRLNNQPLKQSLLTRRQTIESCLEGLPGLC